jgi:hypothetical protein
VNNVVPPPIVRVLAAVRYGTVARLETFVVAEQKRLKAWIAADPRWDIEGLPRAEVARVRAARRAWVAERREAAEVLDTRDAVMTHGVRLELAARGWDHDWPAPPAEAALRGRWPGSRDGGYPERVAAALPPALVERVRGACWDNSAPAIRALWAWRDENPGLLLDSASPALEEYRRLAAQVITHGDIWRAALAQVLGAS